MKRTFVVDQEIKLLDGTDFLNTKVYANTLQKMILNSPANKPFTIGLFGDWGSGKSSIIKTASEELSVNKTFKTRFVIFDAWKYAEDAFRRTFIISLATQLNVNLNKSEYNLYDNLNQQVDELKIKISKRTWVIALLFSAIALLGLVFCYLKFNWFQHNALKLYSLIILFFTTTSAVIFIKKVFDKELFTGILKYLNRILLTKYDIERPLMFSPEQFSNAFDHIVEHTTDQFDRLVIVIDNVDRCEKRYATELLSTIKGFLESKEKVLFVIPVDETALKRHIKETYKAEDKEADEFLRKFFNTTLRIKPFHSSEIYNFAKEINQKYSLKFSDYTLDLVSKEYASNPRRIIQVFNNLSAELECFTENEFAKKHETAICKLLILREEFPAYYSRLTKNYNLLSMPIEGFKTESDKLWSQPLENFLNKTKVITDSLTTRELNQMLSNSTVFSSLPSEIEAYIENLQFEEISKFIGEETQKRDIVNDYLIRQLEIYKDRDLIGASFINSLHLLIKLDGAEVFNTTKNKRIEEFVKPSLVKIIEQENDLKELISYSWTLFINKIKYLMDFIVQSFEGQINMDKPGAKWLEGFRTAIYVYESPSILKKLNTVFEAFYKLDNTILNKQKLVKEQVQALVSNELRITLINQISNIDPNDQYYSDSLFILRNTSIDIIISNRVVSKVNELYPNLTDKSAEQVTELIIAINNLIELLTPDFDDLPESLETLANLIFTDRSKTNPNYPTSRAYDTQLNYVLECINGEQPITDLLQFCSNILRLSHQKANISAVLQQVINSNRYQEQVNSVFLTALKNKISVARFTQLILQDNSYTESSFSLFAKIFSLKVENDYTVNDEQLTNKLTEMILLIVNEDSRKGELTTFLEKNSSDRRVLATLIPIISIQAKADLLKFSNSLQSLALDTILSGDTIFDFADNIQFLKIIASEGQITHVGRLTKLIISKLQKEGELDNALLIIPEIARISPSDKRKIREELESHTTNSDNEGKITEAINYLKDL